MKKFAWCENWINGRRRIWRKSWRCLPAKIERGETQLSIPRLEQLAAIFEVDMWDLLKSGSKGMVLQINDVDSNNGEFAIYASSDMTMKVELLKQELKHCREMLEQKDKEIELLKQLVASVQK